MAYKISIIVCLLSFIGCAVGPDFVRPEVPIHSEWLNATDPKLNAEAADVTAWWETFGDPNLNRLVAEALQSNLSLQASAVRILESRALVGLARGSRFPQEQNLFGQAAAVELSENAPNLASANTTFQDLQFGFDAAWELDIWGRFRRGVEAAQAEYLASIAGYDDVSVRVVAEVARAYILLCAFEERLALALENIGIQQETLRIVEVRFRNGVVTELDVTQARSLLRDTEALIPTLKTSIRQLRNGKIERSTT